MHFEVNVRNTISVQTNMCIKLCRLKNFLYQNGYGFFSKSESRKYPGVPGLKLAKSRKSRNLRDPGNWHPYLCSKNTGGSVSK